MITFEKDSTVNYPAYDVFITLVNAQGIPGTPMYCPAVTERLGRVEQIDRWEAPSPRVRWTLREMTPELTTHVSYHDTLRDAKVHIAARLFVGYRQSVGCSKLRGHTGAEVKRDRINPSRG